MNLLTSEELAERILCSPAALKRFTVAGSIPFIRLGRATLYSEDDVVATFGSRPLLRADQAAALLGASDRQFRFLCEHSKLRSLRLDETLFNCADLEAFLAQWGSIDACERAVFAEARKEAAERRAWRQASRVTSAGIKRLRKVNSGVWYVCWTEGHRSKRVSTGTKDLPEAKRFLNRL